MTKIVRADAIDGAEGREVLRKLGLRKMDGHNDPRSEIWLTETGHPFIFPFVGANQPDRFLKIAFNRNVDEITS